MSKFIYPFILFLFFRLPLWSQTVCWMETFSSGAGWELEQNWTISDDKLQFYWSPEITNFDQKATSEEIFLPPNTTELVIVQHLNVFMNTGNEAAQINLVTSGGQVALWDYPLTGGNWGDINGTEISFPVSAYAGTSVQVQFRTFGDVTYNWNWWDVFEIRVMAVYEHDMALASLTGPSNIDLAQTGSWDISVKNLGLAEQNGISVDLYCYRTGELIGTVYDPSVIAPQEARVYQIDWMPDVAYNTVFYAVISSSGDEYAENNISKGAFLRIEPDLDYSVLIWDNDNDIATVICPEEGDEIQPSLALERAFISAGIGYDLANLPPPNLMDYDMVFATCGCFCVS